MNVRTPLVALGDGAAAFLAIGTAVTVALATDTGFSAIVGLPAGLLVGIGTGLFAYVALSRGVTARFRRLLGSMAITGYVVVGLLAAWNLSATVQAAITVQEVGLVAAVTVVVAYLTLLVPER
ncbi:hypothetical protein SAMN06269185_2668 [Natronoarchaeum philippinense]|uniref:DUF8147 domain-containing protein n=1 Tax=Natronoarchaeum philippinense TaxID=558529 RepID=A0A285P2N3_NATPI|nr:hypothetical protein [Natronoarchaeum philippinense]SNZ15990.1 hypothetical protein SAMN06269185_2668 [Natronoarchaeum philippinense]